MFSTNASSASPCAPVIDSRQLRSPPSAASPLPSGECRFILLHPSIQNQRCSCQGFRLNRAIPGSSCECGHLACYHVPSTPNHDNINLVSFTQHVALMEKVRKLEEDLADSQHALEDTQRGLEDLQRARAEESFQAREAMRRMWRAMEQKMVGLEDKVEAAVDMAFGTRDELNVAKAKIESVEDSTMALESMLDGSRSDDEDDRTRSNAICQEKRRSMSASPPARQSKIPRRDTRPATPTNVGDLTSASGPTALLTSKPESPPTSLCMSPLLPLASAPAVLTSSPSPLPQSALHPTSDSASAAEPIKAYAADITSNKPKPKPKSRGSTSSHAESCVSAVSSPYDAFDCDSFDTPSPVDFLAAITKMPMKRQIREIDNGTVEALDVAGAGGKIMGLGAKKRKRRAGSGVGGAGEGSGAREIGVVKERLLSMPVEDLG